MRKAAPGVENRVKKFFDGRPWGFKSEIAKKLGVSTSLVSKWVHGQPPGMRVLPKLAQALGTTSEFLLSGKEQTSTVVVDDKNLRHVPQVGSASAGEPMAKLTIAKDIPWFSFSESFLEPMFSGRMDDERAILLRVEGDSMEGDLTNGSLVFVDRGSQAHGLTEVNERDIYMVQPPDEEGITLKRVRIQGRGQNKMLLLLPSAAAVMRYPVKVYDLSDGVTLQSIVRGRVVGKFEYLVPLGSRRR